MSRASSNDLQRSPTADATADRSLAALDLELHKFAERLSPDPRVAASIRANANDEYARAFANIGGAVAPAPATFLGRRAPLALLAAMLLAGAFGDINLCEGLSTFGFGTYLVQGTLLSPAFSVIGASMVIVGVVELVLGVGIWARRDWSSPLALAIQSVAILCSLAWIAAGALPQLQILNALVAVVVIALLRLPEIRATLVGRTPLTAS